MNISTPSSRSTKTASEKTFTGLVLQDSLSPNVENGRVTVTGVTFTPGARTNWHTHVLRQILIVTTGSGIVQIKGEEPRRINSGDVAIVPAGVVHWHGAAADSMMTHISVLEAEGDSTNWMHPVDNKDYDAANKIKR
jgi:quercetin dioxygenase-like cupin family protein